MRARTLTQAGRLLIVLMTVASVVSPGLSAAQGLEDSEIRGVVRDVSGAAVRGASLTLEGTSLIGGARALVTDARGTYRFQMLLPGTYSLRAEAPGFTPVVRTNVVLPLATAATVDVQLEIASLTEHVRVTAAGPVVDVRSSAIVTTLDEHTLQALPTRRNVSETLALAPGLFNPSPVPGLVVAFGGTIGSNGLFLDGVDMTEPRRQSAWLPVNYNWLDQVQITALGAGAEYGEFTGAVGNALLRSGGNRFSGLGEYWTTHWQWVGRNGSSLAGRKLDEWWDTTVQAGGPIRRDRLWFFTGVEFYRRKDRPFGYDGDVTRSESSPRSVLKLTGALPGASRLEGHAQRNWATIHAANARQFVAEDAWNQITQSDTSWNVRYTRPIGDRTVFEARHGGYESRWSDSPLPPRTRSDPPPILEGPALRGNNIIYQDNRPLQLDAEATVSVLLPHFLMGSHEIEAGIDLEWNRSKQAQGFPGGRRLFYQGGRLVQVSAWEGTASDARARRSTVYVQDRWSLSDRATLNVGARLDVNRGAVPAGNVLSTNTISPRAGFTWALDTSRNSALKLHYGRYYDALLTERVAFMDIPGIGETVGYNIGPTGDLVEFFRSAPPAARAIDPNIRQSYADQYLVGIERQFFREALFQAHYIRRNYDDFMGMTDTGSLWTPVQLQDPGPDGVVGNTDDGALFTAYRQTNPGAQFLFYTNPPDAYRRYDGVQVAVTKRWSNNWQLQASYTASKTRATVANGDFTNAGLNDTGEQTGTRTPSAFMNPNGAINAEGRATYDKSEFKVLGMYRVPGGVNVSGVVWRQSGNRWERLITYFNTLVPGNFQTIRLEPRGSRETDPVWNVDLRIEPTARLPLGPGRVGVAFDVFNATNQGTPLALDGSSGRSFGAAITRNDPRMLRVVIRYKW